MHSPMVVLKTKEEIALMRKAGKLLAACHQEIVKRIQPGVTTWEIDQFVENYLQTHGATPEQKGYHGYAYATCASVNDVICHGFPKKEPLMDGDIVTIDMVVNLNGWLADSAWSYAVGNISNEAEHLLKITRESLYKGVEKSVVGNRIGDISHAIQSFAELEGLSVVRDFIGHGIGQTMHEGPEVPHFGPPDRGLRLKEGMVITIEPMLNIGGYHSMVDLDGWTARTWDGSLSAQYEHTIAITNEGPQILTQL
jgi:methionyl aminopeptidase